MRWKESKDEHFVEDNNLEGGLKLFVPSVQTNHSLEMNPFCPTIVSIVFNSKKIQTSYKCKHIIASTFMSALLFNLQNGAWLLKWSFSESFSLI